MYFIRCNYLNTKLCLAVFILAISSCSDDGEETPSGISITSHAATQFSNLASVAEEVQLLWPTYDYLTTHPTLMLFDEPNLEITQGYVLNPPEVLPSGSELVAENQTSGYTIYRNSDMAESALVELGEFRRFIFEFPHEGTSYFVIYDNPREGHFYDDYKDATGAWESMILAHELFHKFQFDQWQISEEWVQNIAEYPFEQEILTWHLYYYDLMADAHFAASANDAEAFARRYVAAMTRMQELDTSPEQLVRTMGTYQELMEGSARYIETYSVFPEVYPDVHQDPSHGWRDILNNTTEAEVVRTAIAFRLWYHSGAAATHLLQLLGVDIQSAYPRFETPFELTRDYLGLDEVTLSEIQNEIVSDPTWSGYDSRAADLMLIMDN